jgi:hypothetical protein
MASGALVTIQALTAARQPQLRAAGGRQDGGHRPGLQLQESGQRQRPSASAAKRTCGADKAGAMVAVPFTFDANGKATVTLQYADVGKVA